MLKRTGFTPLISPHPSRDVLLPYIFHQPSSGVPSRIQMVSQCKVLHHRFVWEGGFEPPVHTTLVQTLVSKTSSLNQTRSLPVIGRGSRTRTCDLVLPKHAYYQLYYTPITLLLAFQRINSSLNPTCFFRVIFESNKLFFQSLSSVLYTFFFCHVLYDFN